MFYLEKIFDIYNILETKFFLFFCFCSIFENPQYINSYWCSSYFQDKIPSYFLEEFYHELCRRFTMSFLHKFMNFGEFSRMIIFFDCFLLKSSFPLYVSRKNDKNSSQISRKKTPPQIFENLRIHCLDRVKIHYSPIRKQSCHEIK